MNSLSWVIGLIVTALVCYTIAAWSARLATRLKGWHLAFFWAGLLTDAAGTVLMGRIAGGFVLNVHGVTGLIGLGLMLIHTVWATIVLWRRDERAMVIFQKLSPLVWAVWLIPFVTGMILGRRM